MSLFSGYCPAHTERCTHLSLFTPADPAVPERCPSPRSRTFFLTKRADSLIIYSVTESRCGGTGRRKRLKISRRETVIPVRSRSAAPSSSLAGRHFANQARARGCEAEAPPSLGGIHEGASPSCSREHGIPGSGTILFVHPYPPWPALAESWCFRIGSHRFLRWETTAGFFPSFTR